MIRHLHKKLHKTHSAFAEVSMAAILVWVGSIITVLADIVWLVGDASIVLHTHHYFVGAGLLSGLTLIILSGIWLYKGINRYLVKHEQCKVIKYKTRLVYREVNKHKKELQENNIDLGGC